MARTAPAFYCDKTNKVPLGVPENFIAQPLTSLTDLHTINTRSPADLTPCSTPETDDGATSTDQKLQSPRDKPSLAELFANFLDNYIPQEEAKLQNGHKVPVSWLQAIDPSRVNDDSLDLAILALSLVCLGRKYGDERLRHEGTANYGRALRRLQDILSHHSLLFEEQTLASCMALSTFEASAPSSEYVYRTLVDRVSSYSKRQGRTLADGSATWKIVLALATRRSTYLAQQDWLTVPWKEHAKSDFDQLLDIMAQMAILLEDASRFNASTTFNNIPHAQRIELFQHGWEFHSRLEDWYQGFLRKHHQAGPLYHERPSSARFLSQFAAASVFPTSLHFPKFEIARLHLSYWTILLLLYSCVLTIPPSSPSLGSVNPTSLSRIVGATSVENVFEIPRRALELARMIAQSMEYLLSEDMHILGPQKVFFALRTAMHVFTSMGQGEQEHWCKGIFEELDRRGFPFGKILCRCEWDDLPALLSGKFTVAGQDVSSQLNSGTHDVWKNKPI
ncbi:hypothetical protein AYL99_10653 [Fonsecaea erecta]|uniref:Transcription factor domain-containing protein n=1 Tax=Fonsecaea erecta TaxID=1367422 RepID=A0A178Z6Z2_9EURO|nr:hypothetical protein AYL99_10653 [Fonsecaea erecta]OAP54953.1 hypothetical protein AYL99_10653 [Fonsecaea erecta]